MKNSLSHLPENKQREINRIVEIIKEVMSPEKIILFGSYAKGTYTEHTYTGRDGIRYEYISDYDFLVVTKDSIEKSYELDDQITNRARMFRPSVNMEIHDIAYINEGLEFGQYFFSDIVSEGISLADSGRVSFASPKALSPNEEIQIAKNYFQTWFNRGLDFLSGLKGYIDNKKLKVAAFILHQAAESFYYTTLLVFTGYKPKTHNLAKLKKQIKSISEELYFVFPEDSKKEKHLFDLLKRGYVDARYKENYEITDEEISVLFIRINELKTVVESLCMQKLNQ